MHVARSQAARALDAVRRRHRHRRARQRAAGHRPHPRVVRRAHPVGAVSPRTVDRARRLINELPPVRVTLVEAASARLAAGDRPSPQAIADMAIRRARCDLLD
jgi:hypothetical protein